MAGTTVLRIAQTKYVCAFYCKVPHFVSFEPTTDLALFAILILKRFQAGKEAGYIWSNTDSATRMTSCV